MTATAGFVVEVTREAAEPFTQIWHLYW